MSTDIGVVQGVIQLKDEFTSTIGLASIALKQFSVENQESLKAVAEAGGLVVASFTAIAAATLELGKRGAEVQNVEDTLEHFTGSAANAADVMNRLKAATLGTVEEFDLAKDAAHLLSAGVKLTADDFAILGGAAEVLHKRGLGDTKDALELVSNAMVTGRTRALSMALGVVDISDAEEAYAKKLGVTVDQLNEEGKAQAKRQAIMELLTRSVKNAGEQQRDFGEQLKAARVSIADWVDDLAQAVATSPALGDALRVINSAIKEAFSGANGDLIKDIVGFIRGAAIAGTYFAQGAIEMGRIVYEVWMTLKTVILGVETVIVGVVTGIGEALLKVEQAAAKLHIVPEEEVARIQATQEGLRAMTVSLAEQTLEAKKGADGYGEFNGRLDTVSGTVARVRDALEAASATTDTDNKIVDIAAKNARTLAATQDELSRSMINRQKVENDLWVIEKKSLEETSKLWQQYFTLQVTSSGTSMDAAKAAIAAWRDDEIAKLDDSDRNWQQHYDAIQAVAGEKLKAVELDWASVKDKSIEALNQQAEVAMNTYNEMVFGAQHFTREALQEQLDKVHELRDEARGMGKDFVDAQNAAAAAAKKHQDELDAVKKAADDAAAAARALGGAFDVTSANIESVSAGLKLSLNDVLAYAKKGFSFAEIVAIESGQLAGNSQPRGPRIQGFAEGGVVDIMTGEHGPEVVRVPLGSQVYPSGQRPSGGGGGDINLTFHVNGTGAQAAQQIKDIVMRTLKAQRQF